MKHTNFYDFKISQISLLTEKLILTLAETFEVRVMDIMSISSAKEKG